jgi:hypothetical protein
MGMFKKVLLAGALLAPVLAYGGSPSTDLSVQIVPAASPTPPPTSPTPPAPAQAAGFTTLAENMDFTGASTSKYNNNTFNARVLSNWLDCAGASGSPALWQNGGGPNPTNRCAYSIINDGGTEVLDMDFTPADYSNGYLVTNMQQCNAANANCSVTFPIAKYYEVVMRLTPATLTAFPNATGGAGAYYGDTWSWPTAATGGVEVDFAEFYGNGFVSAGMPGAPNASIPPYNSTLSNQSQYHTYGLLVTSDGSTDVGSCVYYDGVGIGCSDNGNVGSTGFNMRSFLVENTGPYSTQDGAPINNVDILFQRIRVWECAGWATGPCNGQVFNGNPP